MPYSLLMRRDLESLLTGLEQLHAAANVTEWTSATWSAIRGLVDCDFASHLQCSFVTNHSVCHVDDQAADQEFEQQCSASLQAHVMEHPAMVLDGVDRPAALISDFMPLSDYVQSDYYNAIQRPFGIKYSAVLGVGLSPSGELLGFSAERSKRDFSKRETQALALLCRHIRIAHANLGVREALLASLHQSGNPSLRETGGTLLVDSARNIVFQNMNGARVMRHFFPHSPATDRRLPREMMPWVEELLRLRASPGLSPWPPFTTTIGSERLIVRGVAGLQPDHLLLCLFQEPMNVATSPLSRYGLSFRETQVLGLLCEGLTNREIADRFNVTLSTVKTQVANVLRKLSVRNRASAVKLASRWFRGDI